MRTYVVCIDGTWNYPGQKDKDPIDEAVEAVTETNVLRVFLGAPFRVGPRQVLDSIK